MISQGINNPAQCITVKALLISTTAEFTAGGVESPALRAESLLAHVLHCPRLELYEHLHEAVPKKVNAQLLRLVERTKAGEPLQYVIGETDFMNVTLKCDPRALIPRPETEFLVEQVLSCDDIWSRANPRVADIGTGSGCIAISLAKKHPDARIFGVDLHEDALSLARQNARGNGISGNICFLQGDLLQPFSADFLDAAVANLPYIPSEDCRRLPRNILEFEPPTALDGGADGLRAIARLIAQAPRALRSGAWLFLEIGETQAASVIELMHRHGWLNMEVTKDLTGRDRIIRGMRP